MTEIGWSWVMTRSPVVSGVDDVPDIYETQTYAAADRRRDAGIDEL